MKENIYAYDAFRFERESLDGNAKSVRTVDGNGFLHVAFSPVTREQVTEYWGNEIPRWRQFNLNPDQKYSLYRPASELEKPETVESLNGIPIQFNHHLDTAEDPANQTRIGSTGTDAKFKAPYLSNSLHFFNQTAIDRIQDGSMKELSLCYEYDPVPKKGEFNGRHYDFVMKNIRCNHVALVEEGRAGHGVHVFDAKPKEHIAMDENSIENATVKLAQTIVDLHDAEPKQESEPATDTDEQGAIVNKEEDAPVMDETKPTDRKAEIKTTILESLKDTGVDAGKLEALLDELATAEATTEEAPAPAEEEKATDEGEAVEEKEIPAEGEGDEPETALDEDLQKGLKECGYDAEPENVQKAFADGVSYGKGLEKAPAEEETAKDEAEPEDKDEKTVAADAKLIERNVMAAFEAKYQAADECAPILGKIKAHAFDSAASIYRQACKRVNVNVQGMQGNEIRAAFRGYMAGKAEGAKAYASDSAISSSSPSAIGNILNKVKLGD